MRKFRTLSGKVVSLINTSDLDDYTVIGTDLNTKCNSIMGKGFEISNKIRLVVVDEHTLGYIQPETPRTYGVLHASILKGAAFELYPSSKMISPLNKIRLATEKDFKEFRVSFDGYKDDNNYEYSK